MLQIRTNGLKYYSQLDEDQFFSWLEELPFIENVTPVSFEINKTDLTELELRELLALMTRYHLPIKQLDVFKSSQNEGWFNDPEAYWNDPRSGT